MVVVIDVLRSFTTAAYAFAAGACRIHPVETVAEAMHLQRLNPAALTTGAIAGGDPVREFDYGNSPTALAGADLHGRTLIQTTAAGVRGLLRFADARTVYAGTLVAGAAVYNATKERLERVERLVRMHANRREDVDALPAGSIGAIVVAAGDRGATTGDTLCAPDAPIRLDTVHVPEPVIGIAGTDDKCSMLVDELGFDGAINYRTEDVSARLKELCPKRVDVFFDNVGGEVLDVVLGRLALRARIVLCGAISGYNEERKPPGPPNFVNLIQMRAQMNGYLNIDDVPRYPEAMTQLEAWHRDGLLNYKAEVFDGLDRAVDALNSLFTGGNTGKVMLKP